MSKCECDCCKISKSDATVATGTVSSNNVLIVTPTETLSPINEERVAVRVTNSVPSSGANLPVYITLNGSNIPVYDKFGNVLYGYGIRPYVILKGYYGNNGSGSTAHFQIINYPFYRYPRG